MKRLYFIFIAALTLFFILTPLSSSQGAPKAKIDIRFNKLVYRPNDKFSIKGVIKPLGDIADVRVSLKIGPKDHYVYSRTHFLGNLLKDKKQTFEFNKNSAQNFDLKLGSNPLLIEVTQRQKPIYKYSADVGLISPYIKRKMKLALAVNVGHQPHLNIDKKPVDNAALKQLLPMLQKYQQISLRNKSNVNYIFSPLFAETLTFINQQKILSNFNKLFESNTSELVFTSYSQVARNRLSFKSLLDQIEAGQKTLDGAFPKKITAESFIAYPNQSLVKNSPKKNYYLPATKEALAENNKVAAATSAFAALSQSFNDHKKQIVLVTGNMVKPDNISYFIENVKKQDWLALKPLSNLKPYKLKSKPKLQSNSSALSKARLKYFLLKQALASENTAFNQAQMAIYLAEDKNNNFAQSRQLAKHASSLLDTELSKIALQLSPLTLTGREGKLPIKIINNTNSKLNLNLEIKTEGLESKSKDKVFRINPKENLLSIPVKVLKSGRHKVVVQLKTGGVVVTQKSFLVSTNLPSVFWYYSGLSLALIVLLILGAFYVRERRSKIAAEN